MPLDGLVLSHMFSFKVQPHVSGCESSWVYLVLRSVISTGYFPFLYHSIFPRLGRSVYQDTRQEDIPLLLSVTVTIQILYDNTRTDRSDTISLFHS